MVSRALKRRGALIGMMLCVVAGTAQPALAATAPDANGRATATRPSPIHQAEQSMARTLASSLRDPQWKAQVRAAALGTGEVDLQELAARADDPAGRDLHASVAAVNRRIVNLKGLPTATGSLLRVRLGAPAMRARLTADATPWVAVAASDDHAESLTAYDSRGRAHAVDTSRVPDRPLYILDIDVSKAHRAGLALLHKALTDKGLDSSAAKSPNAAAAQGWWATKVTSVEVSDDQEPWFKGAAEMFSLVTGFGLDGKARVDSVDMPYLQYDNTVYYPNQILVNWSNYKYNLADVVMMEDDDGTNYKALAQALTTALLTVTDQGTYIPLVNAVLSAMPDSWFTDDPDYVESWYTLSQNSSGRLNGASGNGWMTVEPYFVEQF
ncbi:DUF3103 family protein [Streptomyces sp. AF1A]|jgi:hypothetical protein|uniref:DUF3103 family protein n=1 Tax=Streptomyces sp. AF1A TaxID=3394350 RepID=UPI0039BD2FAE